MQKNNSILGFTKKLFSRHTKKLFARKSQQSFLKLEFITIKMRLKFSMFDQKYRFQKRQKSIKVHVPTMDDLFNFYVFEIGIFVDFPKGMGY